MGRREVSQLLRDDSSYLIEDEERLKLYYVEDYRIAMELYVNVKK